MKKALLYSRVSTDEQAEKGFSLLHQETSMHKYCEYHNVEMLHHFIEDYSAKNFDRPRWKELMEFIRTNKGTVDILIFVKWDRFSRNIEEAYKVIRKLHIAGIELCCIEQPLDLKIPENKLILANYLVMPEVENDKISNRTRDGMRKGASLGYFMGTAPVGYLNHRTEDGKSTLILDPKLSSIVKKCLEEFSSGHYTAEELRRKYFGASSLRPVSKQTFLNMLRNPTYVGKIAVPNTEGGYPLLVNGHHQAIISMSTFLANKKAFERKNKICITKDRDEFPLRGQLICPICRKVTTGSWSKSRNGNKYSYYHCQKGCKFRAPAPIANKIFEKFLDGFALKDEVLKLYFLVLEDYIKESNADRLKEIKSIDNKIADLVSRTKRLDEIMMDGKLDSGKYNELYSRCSFELEALQEQKKRIVTSNQEAMSNFKSALTLHANLIAIYELADIREKKEIIGSIFPEKLIYDKNGYRTTYTSGLAQHIFRDINKLQGQKKNKEAISDLLSMNAPSPGLEPGTP